MRKSYLKLLIMILLLPPLLSGCWDYIEYEDMALVSAAGIDITESGQVVVTLQYLVPGGNSGGSQGGGLSLVTSALSRIPRVVVADYPYLAHFERAIEICPNGPYNEFNEFLRRNTSPDIEVQMKKTLSYFDIMNLADKITCHCWVSVGLVDDITPPSTVFAVYNHIKCSKEISINRYYGHEFNPGTEESKLRILMKYLQD
jgi:cephalosporin-C deacetylase